LSAKLGVICLGAGDAECQHEEGAHCLMKAFLLFVCCLLFVFCVVTFMASSSILDFGTRKKRGEEECGLLLGALSERRAARCIAAP
jgi:hypothetical protein